MAGAADDDLWTSLKRNARPLPRVTGPLGRPDDDVGALRLGPLAPATSGPLAPYARTPPAPTAESIRKDWREADAFAKSHVTYSPQAKTRESRTQATYGATENLMRDLYLSKKAQAAAGASAERLFANSEFADLKNTRARIGPSPQLSPIDPITEKPGAEHGAITAPYDTGPWIFINPDHPEVSDNARKYGLIAGMNYAPLHELGHAVPGFRHARYGDPILEAQANSDGAAFAKELGAPYPNDLQLRGRAGTIPPWPFGRR